MDYGLIGFIVFLVAVALGIYLKRDKLERQGVFFMFKTIKFKDKIKTHALKHKKFWNIYFNLGIVISFLAMFFGIWFLINNSLIIASGLGVGGFALVLPAPISSFSIQPGLFLVPIWYWLIAIVILIFPHELAHGFALAINKLKIKSLGVFLLLFIPGAFVEPDDKQVKKAEKWKQLQVFCAGSFSNILTALLFILILNIFLVTAYTPAGIYYKYDLRGEIINKSHIVETNILNTGFVEIKTLNETYLTDKETLEESENKQELIVLKDIPSVRYNISGPIKRIGEYKITNFTDAKKVISNYKPNETIEIETTEKIYNITLKDKNGTAYIGVLEIKSNPLLNKLLPINKIYYETKNPTLNFLGQFWLQLVAFIIAVCFGVAIVNILPIRPLDGGLVLETLTNKKLANFISVIIFFLIIYNFVGPYI